MRRKRKESKPPLLRSQSPQKGLLKSVRGHFAFSLGRNEPRGAKDIISPGTCVKNGTLRAAKPNATAAWNHLREKWHHPVTCFAYSTGAPAAESRGQHPYSSIAQNGLPEVLQGYTEFHLIIGHSYGVSATVATTAKRGEGGRMAIESLPPLGVMLTNWLPF